MSNDRIRTKARRYTLHTIKGVRGEMDGAVAQALIRRAEVTRFRRNRVTIKLANGLTAWLVPTTPSRGSAFKLGA